MTPTLRSQILDQTVVSLPSSLYADDPTPFKAYRVDDKYVYLPLGLRVIDSYPGVAWEYPSREGLRYTGTLLTRKVDGFRDQDVLAKQALAQLSRFKVGLLAMSTGYGKTNLGIWLSCALKRRTLILCALRTVLEQWPVEFARFSTAKCLILEGKKTIDPETDVVVVGIVKASNLLDTDPSFFSSFGTVIVDECHLSTKAIFHLLLRLMPEYLIGLSATPDRTDGLDVLFPLFFGPSEDFLIRKQVKSFRVFKVQTKCRPLIDYTPVRGKMVLNWTLAINSLAEMPKRHALIVDLTVSISPGHRVLVLSGRVEEVETLARLMKEKGLDVDTLTGSQSSYRPGVNVLVASRQKAGVGFNDPGLDRMILATDIKDVRQVEGRCRTTNNEIFDLVDDFRTFENHWNLRRKWYVLRGAEVMDSPPPMELMPVGRLLK